MPIGKSAKKSLRKAKSNYSRNQALKKNLKASLKTAKNKPSPESSRAAISAVDKAKKNGVLHKNKVARLKSLLAKIAKPSAKTEVKPKAVKKVVKKKITAKKMK